LSDVRAREKGKGVMMDGSKKEPGSRS
jgi:hypothetical protein